MITSDGKLLIFERFLVDTNLPKYTRRRQKQNAEEKQSPLSKYLVQMGDEMTDSDSIVNDPWAFSQGSVMGRIDISQSGSGEMTLVGNKVVGVVPLGTRIKNFFQRKNTAAVVEEPAPQITIQDFFRSAKDSTEELQVIRERAAGYERSIKQAKEMGQVALAQQLIYGLMAARAETQLIATGFSKYLEEEKVVELYKKAPKGLELYWIGNFARFLPKEATEKRRILDDKEIFDNYVVLTYDPKKKSYAETEEERNHRKDPILFGVISGRRRLYFIHDWVDEVCDLTLDQVADIIGRESISDLASH